MPRFLSCASAQSTKPVGSIENPKQITSADKGPQIDPVKFAASPFRGIPLFRTFRSFMSSCYATADTWIYADGNDQALYDTELMFLFRNRTNQHGARSLMMWPAR